MQWWEQVDDDVDERDQLAQSADLQLLKASTARIEKDVDRLDRKLDTFLTQHAQKHDADQATYNAHVMNATESMTRSLRHEAEIPALEKRMEAIETWRHELLGAMGLMRLTFGTSVLASMVAIASLVILISGFIRA